MKSGAQDTESEVPKKQEMENAATRDEQPNVRKKRKMENAGSRQPKVPRQREAEKTIRIPMAEENPLVAGTQEFPPATLTGFCELQRGSACLIALLWLPRFFVPWITAWYDFNIYVTSNPYHWKFRQGELNRWEVLAFAGTCFVAIAASAFQEIFRTKFDLKYYIFLVLLVLFTLSPVVGGVVDVLLRAGFTDSELYSDWWFTGVVVMRWLVGASFAMFPIQFACIYAQNNNMSRNAHYNWTSLFVVAEFINAHVAFWAIPPKCPTTDWIQIVVWVGIGLILMIFTLLCIIFFFAVPALKFLMLMCIKYCCKERLKDAQNPELDTFVQIPNDIKTKKVMWCSMMLLPIVFTSFSFGVLERFVPDEDWDKHYLWSATSMFYLGRIIGVVVMVVVMFCLRRWIKNQPKMSIWRAEMFYIGAPHVIAVLALLTLVGRFATLSRLKPGEIVFGPIPDDRKTVLIMFNVMFRNRTLCVTSDYFSPVKIRPFGYATRELSDIGVSSFVANVTVDPCTDFRLQVQFVIGNFTKGEWVMYEFVLHQRDPVGSYIWDYYATVYPIRLLNVGHLRPKGSPQVIVFTARAYFPVVLYFYQFNHSDHAPVELNVANSVGLDSYTAPRYPVIFEAPVTGNWTVSEVCTLFNRTQDALDWVMDSVFPHPLAEIELENFTLYVLLDYYYHEVADVSFYFKERKKNKTDARSRRQYTPFDYDAWIPHPHPNEQYVGYPAAFQLVRIAEVAGPAGDKLPAKRELQQDPAIKVALALAGMAAGGIFVGIIYLFWLDPPVPPYRTTTLAVLWVLMGVAAEIPKMKLIDVVSLLVSILLLVFHVASTALHFTGAYFMYDPSMNSRTRDGPDFIN